MLPPKSFRLPLTSTIAPLLTASVAVLPPLPRFNPEVCTTDCKGGKSGETAAGDLDTPWGVAATAGEIYVSEISNNRISVFDYEGHFLRAFGSNVGGPGSSSLL